MLRKLNFTERARVPRANVRITLRRDADGTLVFDPRLIFDDVGAPPDDRRLTDIENTSLVRFRVKLVDNEGNEHRIVAMAARRDLTQ
jgi:hypothetical protein